MLEMWGSPALPVAPFMDKGVICWVFPRAYRPATRPREDLDALTLRLVISLTLSCNGGALARCEKGLP